MEFFNLHQGWILLDHAFGVVCDDEKVVYTSREQIHYPLVGTKIIL